MLKIISRIAWVAAFFAGVLFFALQSGSAAPGLRRIEGELRAQPEFACNDAAPGCVWTEHAEITMNGEKIPLNNAHGFFDNVCGRSKVVPRIRAYSGYRAGDDAARLVRAEVDCGAGFKPFKRFLRSRPIDAATLAVND